MFLSSRRHDVFGLIILLFLIVFIVLPVLTVFSGPLLSNGSIPPFCRPNGAFASGLRFWPGPMSGRPFGHQLSCR